MKNKILKLTSIVTIICIITAIFVPSIVKSAQAVVSNMNNTWRGIGDTKVFTVSVNGYNNLYCAKGGAPLNNGTVLNDDGISLYNTTKIKDITTSPSALSWILDNIYLSEETNSSVQKAMKDNLKNVIKKYSTYKDSNGAYILSKKVGVGTIDDNWISTAVEALIQDKTTLFATQQYVIWNYVKNASSSYNNTMQNSDGSYNALPNAKVDKKYYTALYISLNELAKQAQKNGYVSPNTKSSQDITMKRTSDLKTTIQNDRKTVLVGPYKLVNNSAQFTKSFSATVNSNKADKIETVDVNGKAISVKDKQDEFYVKITYSKGFEKGTKYNININVKIDGYKTFATLLNPTNGVSQPLISIRKEVYSANSSDVVTYHEELKGNYSLILEKVDSKNKNTKISGITFKVKEGSQEAKTYGPTDSNGLATIFKDKAITQEGVTEYTITEVDLGSNEYIKLKDEIKVYITTTKSNGAYVASKVSFDKDKETISKEVTLQDNSKVTILSQISGNTVKITIPNKPDLKGKYTLILEKTDSINEHIKLPGVTFKVKEDNQEVKTYGPTQSNGEITIFKDKEIKEKGIKEYTITEISVGSNAYIKIKDEIKVYITITEEDNVLVASKVSFDKESEITSKEVILEDNTKVTITSQIYGSKVLISIPNKKNTFDLALRKFITKINNKNLEVSREPVITLKSATSLRDMGTAIYNNPKDPIKVKEGDIVTYKIRIYNEGYIDGYAKEITDYLPNGLEFIENSQINKDNGWTITKNEDGTTTVKTEKLRNTIIPTSKGAEGYQKLTLGINETEFWKDVEIECKVKENIGTEQKLSNVAEITNYGYMDGEKYVEANKNNVDRDSKEDNVFKEKDKIQNSINEYYNSQYGESNKDYYPGKQDDDDFENLYVAPSLSEFKFVLNKVDENGNPLIGADFTVKREKDSEDKILLNNQEVKGTYEVLEGEVQINKTYTYRVIEVESAPEYVNVMEGKYITLRVYMNKDKELILENYEKIEQEDSLINKYGFVINNQDGSIVKETETDLYEKIKVKVNNEVVPAKVEITIPNTPIQKEFDLALRKFITEIRTGVGSKEEDKKEITDRVPVFKIDENGNYVYEHTKEPLIVTNNNIVVYTLRVYNEGQVDGYATQIKDDIPDGLEFLPLDLLNEEYRWKMIDKYGKETTEVQNAKYIVSDYLSKEQESEPEGNLLKAFDLEKYESGEIKEPSYKEVKVAFKVNTDERSEEIIINQAQISDDSDKDGNEVTDKDSTPDKWIEGEDDQDIEKIKVQYFDLSLRKWVTKAIVVEDGKQTITETGHSAEDDPEEIVKVDLNKSKINDVTVKFEYSIRVKNEGQIAGYAKEISDYIPEGLKFVQEDNPDWQEADGSIVTEKLKDTLLQPGDTAEVNIILTWINSEKNMGLKVNTAEISKDYNDYGTPDIDSTPGNKVPGEDDIDDAPVMLTVKTGQTATYVGVTLVVLIMLASGLICIKKFVLK